MSTFEELKKKWNEQPDAAPTGKDYDRTSLEKAFKSRIKKHKNIAMQYFWASLVFQILIYALLSNVIIKHWFDPEMKWMGMAGILLYIPFTFMLMTKFKRMANPGPSDAAKTLNSYVLQQQTQLLSFYNFKKLYELILIPLSTAIGVILTFKLYVPGGVMENQTGATITFVITLLSCAWAIRAENKKNFEQPLQQFKLIINDFEEAR
jgi:hypothetical protein